MKLFTFKKAMLLVLLGAIIYFSYPYFLSENGNVNEATVVSREYRDFILTTGNIVARDDVVLSFERGGAVSQINYEPGDIVVAGGVIASLDTKSLENEIDRQSLKVNREYLKLNSLVDGPEENEKNTIDSEKFVSQQNLENQIIKALVEAQQSAVFLENSTRTELDLLFGGDVDDPRFEANLGVLQKREINKKRLELEKVFNSWRSWSNINQMEYEALLTLLNTFNTDLRTINSTITEVYYVILDVRNLTSANENSFLAIAKQRQSILDLIVSTSENINSLKSSKANLSLAIAKSQQALSGGSGADKLTQFSIFEAEKEALEALRLDLADAIIFAPFTGVIGEVSVERGEFVASGEKVVRFISSGGYEISANITEVEISEINPGLELKAYVDALDREIAVRVRTADVTENKIGDIPVYKVVFDILEQNLSLRPGMSVDVTVPYGETRNAFVIPKTALIRSGNKSLVEVKRNGSKSLVEVTTITSFENDNIGVSGDLIEGDTVLFKNEK